MDKVRCPACRGSKKVSKLGGMIGECNTCEGTGQINAIDKPKPVEVTIDDVIAKELINAVADCVPASKIDTLPVTPDIKIDGKRALYKRKTASTR